MNAPNHPRLALATAKQVQKALTKKRNPEKAAFFPRFFRTGPGEYGEGDQFIGVIVPEQRKIAKISSGLSLDEIERLLESPFHECRLTGLFILVNRFEKARTKSETKSIYDFYVRKIDRINNWDLVDSSCHKIMGPYLLHRSHAPLMRFAKANHLWKNRSAIVTTYHFIKNDDYGTTLELSERLLDHPHDLIHKGVGWMLRELGKRNEAVLVQFLGQHAPAMPRTMLRYAIEKFSKSKRQRFMAMKA